MNRKPLIVSALTAVVGVVLLQIYMHRFEQETSGGPTVPILVAAQDIAPGTPLRSEMLGVRNLPQAYLDQRHIRASDIDKILNATVNSGVKAAESLLWTDLSTLRAAGHSLSGLVQDGMRALTINAGWGAFSGLIRPGDRVDVLYTAGGRLSGESAESTATLVQNLLVLAVGADTGEENSAGNESGADNQVTLSVTADQAQLLTQAGHQGSLNLALRNPNDIVLLQGLPKTYSADVSAANRPSGGPRYAAAAEATKEIEHVR